MLLLLLSYFSGLIIGCLQGAEKEKLLSPNFSPTGSEDYWKNNPMVMHKIVLFFS